MIIKSMSRKEGSYGQLYDYMKHGASKADDKYAFIHNCFGRNRDDIVLDFEEHGNRLAKRKNGVYLYHEIISITRSKILSEDEQKKALFEIVQEYVKKRAPKQLSCGFMHDEKDNNLHFHLMISSSQISLAKRARLNKQQFADVKIGLEEWVLAKYPELEQAKLISKESSYRTDKEQFVDCLQSIFSTATTRAEFHELLKTNKAGYKIRGETVTFINEKTKKRHRVKTLGLDSQYKQMLEGFEKSKTKEPDNKSSASVPVIEVEKPVDEESAHRWGSAKEWVFGDFTEREKKMKDDEFKNRKAGYKKQDRQDSKVKDKEDQTVHEKAEEALNELVYGDFSARDSRTRKAESAKKLKEWREKQMAGKSAEKQEIDEVKLKNGTDIRTFGEKAHDVFDEWVAGDFSAREARSQKEKSAEKLKKLREKQNEQSNQKGHKQ